MKGTGPIYMTYFCPTRNSEMFDCPISAVPGKIRDIPDGSLVGCSSCASIFHYEDYSYKVNYQSGTMHQHSMHLPPKPSKPTNYNQMRIDEIILLKAEKLLTSVLDFGSGAGEFSKVAKLNGFEVSAFEIDNSVLDSANYTGIPLFQKIEDIPKEKFDLVTMFHVIEHVPDPRKILSEVYRALKKNQEKSGLLVIETPNSQDALVSKFQVQEYLDWTYWSHHPLLYSASSLISVVQNNGFRVKSFKYIQRYSLDSHLGWIIEGTPGGHLRHNSNVSENLKMEYDKFLAKQGQSDTLFLVAEKI
jgi:2-polyprenyl-3-methyl-5-hydroxy-6-metoxy-1,4-benzoquinol methylase